MNINMLNFTDVNFDDFLKPLKGIQRNLQEGVFNGVLTLHLKTLICLYIYHYIIIR